jgi:chromosome partitioning protein
MHIAVALMKCGFRVGTIDLDSRQGTFSTMMENRESFARDNELDIPIPRHHRIFPVSASMTTEGLVPENEHRVSAALEDLSDCDFVIIDTPGTDSPLSRAGHSKAHTLITPINDSFVDLDVLAKVDHDGSRMLEPSIYSRMIWELQENRAKQDKPGIDWLVMRNRLSKLNSQNNETITDLFRSLRRQVGFREAPGFSERVIFRELFPKGLTLLDLRDPNVGVEMNMSHVAAREEVRQLLKTMGLTEVADRIGGRPERPAFIFEKLRPRSMDIIRIDVGAGAQAAEDEDQLELYGMERPRRKRQAVASDATVAPAAGNEIHARDPSAAGRDGDASEAEAGNGGTNVHRRFMQQPKEYEFRSMKRYEERKPASRPRRGRGAVWGSLAALIVLTVSAGFIVEARYPGGVAALSKDITGDETSQTGVLDDITDQAGTILHKFRNGQE